MGKTFFHKNKFRGFRLKQLRTQRGLTQKQCENFVGLSIRTVGKFELERMYPNDAAEEKLCAFFKVDREFFRRDSD